MKSSKSLISQYKNEIEELKKLDPQSLNGQILELSLRMNEFLGIEGFGDFDYSSEYKSGAQMEHERKMNEFFENMRTEPLKQEPAYLEMERQMSDLEAKQWSLRFKWEDVHSLITV